jgi:hypothetical protein
MLAVALALVGVTRIAHAQNLESCREDAARICPGVRPGGGRIAACFHQHADALSPQCRTALGEASSDSRAASATGAPQTTQRTYAALEQLLTSARKKYRPDAVAGLPKPEYFTDLLAANSNAGEALLQPQTMGVVKLSLDRLKAMGITGVKFALQYPLLRPGFPRADEYLAFYKQVAAEAHRRGLKILPHVTTLFGNTPFSSFNDLYAGLTPDRFAREYRDMVHLVLKQLKPDYLGLITEPDTLVRLTGLQAFGTPRAEADLINTALEGADRGRTQICAGAGSWNGIDFARALASRTTLDALCIHIYPIQGAALDNAAEMAAIAHAAGKKAWIDEAWLYKTVAPAGGDHVAASGAIFGNDVYSYWEPLDAQFLEVVNALARRNHVSLLSFFWSRQFFAYLQAGEGGDSWQGRSRAENRAAAVAMQAGNLSRTGQTYKDLIAAP